MCSGILVTRQGVGLEPSLCHWFEGWEVEVDQVERKAGGWERPLSPQDTIVSFPPFPPSPSWLPCATDPGLPPPPSDREHPPPPPPPSHPPPPPPPAAPPPLKSSGTSTGGRHPQTCSLGCWGGGRRCCQRRRRKGGSWTCPTRWSTCRERHSWSVWMNKIAKHFPCFVNCWGRPGRTAQLSYCRHFESDEAGESVARSYVTGQV